MASVESGGFPFPTFFERDTFIGDVERAWAAPDRGDEDEIGRFLREKGLRFVIEAAADMGLDIVTELIQEHLHPKTEVEPLFVEYEGQPLAERLKVFFLAFLRGVIPEETEQNAFDIAYALRERCGFRSVEPDLAYGQFLGPPGLPPPLTAAASVDHAWSVRNIKADSAWSVPPTVGQGDGGGISVGHLDTGWTQHTDLDQVNFDHSRAKDFITEGGNAEDPLNYSGNPGHGTKTGSVIMSRGGVTQIAPLDTTPPGQVTGIARKATHVAVRCIKSVVIIFNGDVARAVQYAAGNYCDVISMSLGGRKMKALEAAVQDAVTNQVLVVAAAGNRVKLVVYPARYPETIAVAATNSTDVPWSGSSRGKAVDISAPGEAVWHASPDPAGAKVEAGDGTSYATANLAGVAALWLAFHDKAGLAGNLEAHANLQEMFRQALSATARVPPGWDATRYGAGIVDAEAMLQNAPPSAGGTGGGGDISAAQHVIDSVPAEDPERVAALFESMLARGTAAWNELLEAFGDELINVLLEDAAIVDVLEEGGSPGSDLEASVRTARVMFDAKMSSAFRNAANW